MRVVPLLSMPFCFEAQAYTVGKVARARDPQPEQSLQ